jgi:hypothetical protein
MNRGSLSALSLVGICLRCSPALTETERALRLTLTDQVSSDWELAFFQVREYR